MEKEKNFLDELKEYFERTPRKKIDADWEEAGKNADVGVDEYFKIKETDSNKFPLIAKDVNNLLSELTVCFIDETTGIVIEEDNVDNPLYEIGEKLDNFMSCFNKSCWEIIVPPKTDPVKTIEEIKKQAEVVSQNLTYHFKGVEEKWNAPKGMPFMKEVLNDIDKLCELAKGNDDLENLQ